jgi:hypothetical protein
LRKTVYGRIEGDSIVLAIPDLLVKSLPKNRYAFRDRNVLALDASRIKQLRITRDNQTYAVVPSTGTGPVNSWKMTEPAQGKADMPSVSQIVANLSQLRAEEFVGDSKGQEEDAKYGLDHPNCEVAWEIEDSKGQVSGKALRGPLKIGNRVGRTASFFAKLEGLPMVFTIADSIAESFVQELYDHTVMSFSAGRVSRVILRRKGRMAAFNRQRDAKSGAEMWNPDPSTDSKGIDASEIPAMMGQIARLQTTKFVQYSGIYPAFVGLSPPRLTVEVQIEGDPTPRVLKIGNPREGEIVYGGVGTDDRGPVFLLPGTAWNHMIESSSQDVELPDDVFAPASKHS